MRVFYNGENFFGYQRQPHVPTVEGTIIKALIRTGHIDDPKKNDFKSASRTDKHVSAIGNVFSFFSNKNLIIDQINADLINKEVVCWAYSLVGTSFSPRYPEFKKYWYILPNSFLVHKGISTEALENILKNFVGTHNFRLFCKKDERETVRTINAINIIKRFDVIIIEFIAKSFVWQQIRRIVSYAMEYYNLPPKLQNIKNLLGKAENIGDLSIKPADPRNLMLVNLHFPEIKWQYSIKAIKNVVGLLDKKVKNLINKQAVLETVKDYFKAFYS